MSGSFRHNAWALRQFVTQCRFKEACWVALVVGLASWGFVEQRENTRLRSELTAAERAALKLGPEIEPPPAVDPAPATPAAPTVAADIALPAGYGRTASGVRPATFP